MSYLLLGILFLTLINFFLEFRSRKVTLYEFTTTCWSLIFIGLLISSNNQLPLGVFHQELSEPGSLSSRLVLPIADPTIRRLLEPSIWIFITLIINLTNVFSIKKSKLINAALFLVISCWITGALNLEYHNENIKIITHYGWLISLMLISLALSLKLFSSQNRTNKSSELRLSLVGLTIFLIIGIKFLSTVFWPNNTVTTGVHFYSWFPENWSLGYGNSSEFTTEACYKPAIGEYNYKDIETIKTQFKNIEAHGIDLLIYDWWPSRRDLKNRVIESTKLIKDNSNLKFAVHFESLDIQDYPKTNSIVTLNSKMTRTLVNSFEFLAKEMFSNERYYKIDGKPVVFMYATRHLVGNVSKSILETRKAIKNKYNLDLYLIGDEAYFHVPTLEKKKLVLLPEYIPNWNRLKAFDAIGLYNPYDPTKSYEGLHESDLNRFFSETEKLYANYQYIASTLGIPFYPTIIPSYNDKKMRPMLSHEIIPEVSTSGERTFDVLASISKNVNLRSTSKHKISTITSWNEWNEGTQIEEKVGCSSQ